MNKHVISGLLCLQAQTKDPYRKNAYNNAIKTLEGMSVEVTSGGQLKGILSKRMCDKVAFILTQPAYTADPLESVWGIGPAMAERLRGKGIHSIDDLKAGVLTDSDLVPAAVLVTLKYHSELKLKMSRNTISSVLSVVSKKLPNLTIETCGSYRRGLSVSGDMDILVTSPLLREPSDLENNSSSSCSTQGTGSVMADVLACLKDTGLLVAVLSSKHKKAMCVCNSGMSPSTPTGVFHLDIRVVLQREYPFALLYFTGSKKMNTVMRQKAMDLGYKLNEYCLTDLKTGTVCPLNSERAIFEKLCLEYKEPGDRSLL